MQIEAAISMDAATRAEKQYMKDSLTFPFNTWNYGHNRNYLSYIQEQLGMAEASIFGARQLIDAPLDPTDNSDKPYSSYSRGIAAISRALVKFERWEDLLNPKTIPWRDLLRLTRVEVVWELMLPLPWLLGSLVFYQAGHWVLGAVCSFYFFLTGLRQSHGAPHYTLAVPRLPQALVMFGLSLPLPGDKSRDLRLDRLVALGYAAITHQLRGATDELTLALVDAVQQDGTCWCGPTMWKGRPAMRISISGWATTEDDVDQSAEAIMRAARLLSATTTTLDD